MEHFGHFLNAPYTYIVNFGHLNIGVSILWPFSGRHYIKFIFGPVWVVTVLWHNNSFSGRGHRNDIFQTFGVGNP